MSIVKIIDDVTSWAQEEICAPVKLKCPPDGLDNEANDENYEYQLITPAAFPLYIPTKEKLPPKIISPIPSVCVRVLEGEETLAGNSGKLKLDMVFCTWNTGTHGKDVLLPAEKEPGYFQKLAAPEAAEYFERNAEGWRDAWNWVDVALRSLESTTDIAGHEIYIETPVKFGPITEQEDIPDLYPMWFAWISFAVKYPLIRNVKQFKGLL